MVGDNDDASDDPSDQPDGEMPGGGMTEGGGSGSGSMPGGEMEGTGEQAPTESSMPEGTVERGDSERERVGILVEMAVEDARMEAMDDEALEETALERAENIDVEEFESTGSFNRGSTACRRPTPARTSEARVGRSLCSGRSGATR
ncbi:hypothetical protein [Halorussus caseinilyticus]|uniref:Uncharacterized protein n=1 Tax=Halorussus caseinilyticus TaxID=3034025 RepID=A0ABD5WLD7_9EURY